MAADKINYLNKVDGDQVTSADMNQIKSVSINHADLLDVVPSQISTAQSAAVTTSQNYTDAKIEGLQAKQPADVATTANITLSGTQTIDGIAVTAGMRVLVKNQTTASQNGIYICASGAWSRSSDMNTASEFPSAYIPVSRGSLNGDTQWKCTNDTVVVGTTAITIVAVTVSGVELISNKGVANGYVPLNASARIDPQYLPASVSPINKIGSIFNYSTFPNNTDFVLNGVSAPASAGKLQISGGSAFGPSIDFDKVGNAHRYTCLENWHQTVTFTVTNVAGSTTYGLAPGIHSDNSQNAHSLIVWYDTSTGGSPGKLSIYRLDKVGAGSVIQTNLVQGTTIIPVVQGHSYTVEAYLINGFTLIGVVTDNNTGATTSVGYTIIPTSGNSPCPNTGKFALWALGGTQDLTAWSCSSESLKGVPYIFVGDSKTKGFYAGSIGDRFANRAMNGAFEVNAGGDNMTESLVKNIAEIIDQVNVGGFCFLMIGGNDVRYGVSSATWQANMNTIRTALTTAGIIPIWLLYPPEIGNTYAVTVNTYILATFGSDIIIDTFTPLTIDLVQGSPAYLHADLIHPKREGHDVLGTEIKKYFSYK